MLPKNHVVKVTYVGKSGLTITRPVTIAGSRTRGEARARVEATAKAYIPAGATVKAVEL